MVLRITACVLALATPCAAESFSSARWWPPSQRQAQQGFEKSLNSTPAASSLRAYHDMMGSEPHIAGTPGDQRNIQRMAEAFKSLGLEVQVHEIWPYLCRPI